MNFVPSNYQNDIFNHVEDMFYNGGGSLGVVARAGSGKTTTAVQATRRIPPYVKARFLAFNKAIANDLAKKLPQHFQASTMHSLAFGAVRNAYGKPKVDGDKMGEIFEKLVPKPSMFNEEEKARYYEFKRNFKDAISWAKNLLIDWHNESDLIELINTLDLDGYEGEIMPLIPDALEMSIAISQEMVDFDDMIWLPVKLHLPLFKYDFLIVDESQDLNLAQIELIRQSLDKSGKVLIIGDPKQSIYQWRGADEQAMYRLMSSFNAEQLPLPITYRCPVSVVEYSRQYVPDLEYRENAPLGEIKTLRDRSEMKLEAQDGDMILCRVNAPLASTCFSFLKEGRKASIQGRDIGKNLAAVARKIEARSESMKDVYDSIYYFRSNEIEKVHNNQYLKNKAKKIDFINDRYDTITAVADNITHPGLLSSKLLGIFSGDTSGIVLSTVHRAKGLEANNVFIIRPDLMPHPLAKSEGELEQERNLQYVAWTRTKNKLCFVQGE